MSRTEANARITKQDMRDATEGVLVIGGGIDEAPQAYKDIECVMDDQEDLVERVQVLKPKAVIKG